MGITGIGLLYVGCVLLMNGIATIQKSDAKAKAVMNFFTGGLYVALNLANLARAVFSGADISAYYGIGTSMLFGFTYLYVAFTDWFALDGRSLAWYCFFVGVNTVPCAIQSFCGGDVRFGVIWLIWGFLWFLYWLAGAFKKIKVAAGFVGAATVIIGVATCWIPGYLIISNLW
ncbi:AmiS/UreI family transporter [Treponema endosymbiont of Eucomonympha sp.]|uniref:AmiS/UreI family transporter n=1 Tax=Treponema endosymbiont of Eucomonympha sp. TaxID=1580831 RepID=UPI000ACACD73|nr:AmiS/UreI family transporter [Treponema endosymbiont of Eucomonympha sp.]